MNAMYELRNVEVVFGSRRVLRVPELSVHAGETLGVIGPSGAGKTTLLRLLAMLDRPTAGEISYRGLLLNGSRPIDIRREVTMVFQRPELLDQSVAENVEYGLKVRGERDPDRVHKVLTDLGIDYLANQPVSNLSGGELQRVAVARALVIRPSVFLLDEPTANLDPENVAILERAFESVKRTDQTTVVLVSHNLHQVQRLASRLAAFIGGELVECGEVEQVLTATRDRRLRDFISGGIRYWGD